jgi:hypothetical protein
MSFSFPELTRILKLDTQRVSKIWILNILKLNISLFFYFSQRTFTCFKIGPPFF